MFQLWCYIPEKAWYIFIALYTFYWTFLIINSVIIIKVIRFLKREITPTTKHIDKLDDVYIDRIKAMINSLYRLPVITIILWLIATINRFYELFLYFYDTSDDSLAVIRLVTLTLHSVSMCSRGLIYAFIYCKYDKIKYELSEIWRHCCGKTKRPSGYNKISDTHMNSF
jgi:hypothetical protein